MSKPKVWYLPPRSHTLKVFQKDTYEDFLRNFDVRENPEDGKNYTSEELANGIDSFDAVVTGWGSPPFSPQVFENAGALKMVAHSAGSVKFLFSEEVFDNFIKNRDFCVFSANGAIALNVAEHTVGALIWTCRRIVEHALNIREKGLWRDSAIPQTTTYLRGAIVGIVSASTVGREVIRLLKAFDVHILCYDPYLSDEAAKELGVETCELDDLFRRSDHVTVHTPITKETIGLIGARQLGLLRDGASLVNTSRGKIVEADALLKEAETGRIFISLDVTDPEPLPPEHPLRALPNVYLSPHISGQGAYGYYRIGQMTLQALRDSFAGRPVAGRVRLDTYDQIG